MGPFEIPGQTTLSVSSRIVPRGVLLELVLLRRPFANSCDHGKKTRKGCSRFPHQFLMLENGAGQPGRRKEKPSAIFQYFFSIEDKTLARTSENKMERGSSETIPSIERMRAAGFESNQIPAQFSKDVGLAGPWLTLINVHGPET